MNKQSSLNFILMQKRRKLLIYIKKLLPLIKGSEDVSQFIDVVSHTK